MALATATHTRTGKLKINGFGIAKLTEMAEKASRPRDRAKYENRIKVLVKQAK